MRLEDTENNQLKGNVLKEQLKKNLHQTLNLEVAETSMLNSRDEGNSMKNVCSSVYG